MIFVTYGTQPHNFEFLTTVVNQINSEYQVVAQIGESTNSINRPNTMVFDYSDDFSQYVADCDILITHGGVGSIMAGLKQGKKVIVVARLAAANEHIDDHQLEVTNKLAVAGYVYQLNRDQDINQVLAEVSNATLKPYKSNTVHFVSKIEDILLGGN